MMADYTRVPGAASYAESHGLKTLLQALAVCALET
jgi:hypothetical protein